MPAHADPSTDSGCDATVKMNRDGPALEPKIIHMSRYTNERDRNKLDQGDKIFEEVDQYIQEFVLNEVKRRPITKILLSTNGIAAVKCILSMRKFSLHVFRNDKKIRFISLTTEQEIASNAEYLKMADKYTIAPAGENKNNYANVDLIVQKAIEEEVDAVWAGWGHASENPELPRKLHEAGIAFIGPPASAMFALGDKIASTIIAQSLDIPTIEWSGSGIRLNDENMTHMGEVTVDDILFQRATVTNVTDGLNALLEHRIGYPLMIKASEGGGGKGIRKCLEEADFAENFQMVQSEVPGSPIFLMKCVENARHIEVQLIADRYGNVVPIYTRDCSIQRRCQKIIEEAPASIAPEEILRSMQEDAVKLAKLVGYESAGTVEYMYLPDENKYFFLELNPRLQVEHPCTEMIANIDIPSIQLQIAMGVPLHRIPDIRMFYNLDRYGTSSLPENLVRTDCDYHVIAARITSEDPEDFFRPSTGQVETLNFQSYPNVWGYFSVSSAGKVHEFADSQFGHVFSKAKSRHEATTQLLSALGQLEIRATFTSQMLYLIDMLKDSDFTENKFNTQWLDNRIGNKIAQRPEVPKHEMIAISSAVIGYNKITDAFTTFKAAVTRGQVLPTTDLTETVLFDLVKDMLIYKVTVTRRGPTRYTITMNGGKTLVEMRPFGETRSGVLVTYNERSYACNLEESTDKYKVSMGRTNVIFEKDNDPAVLKSPYTGKLLSYKKANREMVNLGTTYATIESMKLVFSVEVHKAPGRLVHVAKEGDLLYPGSVIARLVDQKDGDKYRPKPFNDPFPEWNNDLSQIHKRSENKRFLVTYQDCKNILNGSIPPEADFSVNDLVDKLMSFLESATLADSMIADNIDVLKRLPVAVEREMRALASGSAEDRFDKMKCCLEKHIASVDRTQTETQQAVASPLLTVCHRLSGGPSMHTVRVIDDLLDNYYQCERFFEGRLYDDAVTLLNEQYPEDKDEVVKIIYSHTQMKGKNRFMVALLQAVEKRIHFVGPLAENLRKIGNIFHTDDVSNQARILLLLNSRTKYRMFVNKILWDVRKVELNDRNVEPVLTVCEAVTSLRQMFIDKAVSPADILDSSPWIHKAMHEFFFDDKLADAFIRAYIGQHFCVHDITSSAFACGKQDATVYDFCVDNSNLMHYMISPSGVSNQFLSIVKFSVNATNFTDAITHENLLHSLISKYSEVGIKANGVRSQLRVTLLVNVMQDVVNAYDIRQGRAAQLEELPAHSAQDYHLVSEAEKASHIIRQALSEKLVAVDIMTTVLICPKHRPLMQLDLLGAESLELWRLPEQCPLESDRLSNLNVFKYDDEKEKKFSKLFVREILEIPLRTSELSYKDEKLIFDTITGHLDNACGAINVTMRKYKKIRPDQRSLFVSNHIFFYVTFPKLPRAFTRDHCNSLEEIFMTAVREQRNILYKHHVTEVEMVFEKLQTDGNSLIKQRVKFLDDTGVTPEFGIYEEHKKTITPQRLSYQLYTSQLGAYEKIKRIEKKRVQTRVNGTTYVYDYPMLFGRACLEMWKKLHYVDNGVLFEKQYNKLTPAQKQSYRNGDYRLFFQEQEMVLRNGSLVHISDKNEMRQRADNCNNETGMVAWELKLFTPEKPQGYSIVVIANDITFQSGSFATPEDEVYSLASQYSRKNKLPRVNVSCNSGARIGLADEISKAFRAKFNDPSDPTDLEYIYLEGDADQHLKDQVVYEKQPNGQLKIKSVVGRADENIGVENLQGSGLIAGETSAAYDEVPTYCYVTGRSVGIGAYTARLAHRIVQAKASHIILTGASALNTLLGKEVYTSNNQLGGVQIMHKNGVTHAVVDDDFEGICKIVQWMSFLPSQTSSFPYREAFGPDSAPRDVVFNIDSNNSFDIRKLIDSGNSEETQGICDSGSFDEIMQEWAKTIIAGRARIGGMPIGVVCSELRNVMSVNPADPASPNSQSVVVHQAGQVWYPDSAFKTAEVIGDFNREGLPLLFIASLRGFSGGQKDMFDMVLKFGAQIVDALRQYRMPVVIYIPVQGELRGGAWAVLDSQINPGFITMVADEESRGGILEPNAIVGIKFRADKTWDFQKRNDPELKAWDKELQEEVKTNGPDSMQAKQLKSFMAKRVKDIEKSYKKVTVEFADLHDRADRMFIKKAVQHRTFLQDSRNLFTAIFQLETAKIHLSEQYTTADRDVNRNEAYKWMTEKLEDFHPGVSSLPPAEQMPILEEFVTSGGFSDVIRNIREESIERELSSISVESQTRIINRWLQARKGSV